MGLLDRLLRPKEVADCLIALDLIRPLFARDDAYNASALVFKRVSEGLHSADGRAAVVESIKNGSSPHECVLYAIAKASQQVLSSGKFHVCRGVLNGQGRGVDATFNTALDELVKTGFTNQQEANEQRKRLATAVKEIG